MRLRVIKQKKNTLIIHHFCFIPLSTGAKLMPKNGWPQWSSGDEVALHLCKNTKWQNISHISQERKSQTTTKKHSKNSKNTT